MNIVLTGSLGNIGKPLAIELVQKGHSVTVISSKADRQKDIEALGAKAAIGTMQDVEFLANTFKGADTVYLMEAWEGIGSIFDKRFLCPDISSRIGGYTEPSRLAADPSPSYPTSLI